MGDANTLRYKDFLAFNRLLKNQSAVDPFVEKVAWSTVPVDRLVSDMGIQISNHGGIFNAFDVKIIAVSPNYFEAAEPTFLSIYNEWSWAGKLFSKRLSMLEELYTSWGSQGTILPASYESTLYISRDGYDKSASNGISVPNPISIHANLETLVKDMNIQPYTKVYHLLPLHMLNNGAGIRMGKYQSSRQNIIVSLPEYVTIANGIISSIEDIPISKIIVRLKPNLSVAKVDTIAKTLSSVLGRKDVKGKIFNLNDRLKQIESIVTTINFFFVALTIVGMTLCFFSLLASMIANITEQTKDIAILRSLGLSQGNIILVFTLEAFILVVASSFLGGMAGYLVAWTISSQRALVTQVPVNSYFPLDMALLILLLALIFGVLSSLFPARFYARKHIAHLVRQ